MLMLSSCFELLRAASNHNRTAIDSSKLIHQSVSQYSTSHEPFESIFNLLNELVESKDNKQTNKQRAHCIDSSVSINSPWRKRNASPAIWRHIHSPAIRWPSGIESNGMESLSCGIMSPIWIQEEERAAQSYKREREFAWLSFKTATASNASQAARLQSEETRENAFRHVASSKQASEYEISELLFRYLYKSILRLSYWLA